jgi:hypothetical protein
METSKQVWVESFYGEPMKHEYDVFTKVNDDFKDYYIMKDCGTDEVRCELIDDEDNFIVKFDDEKTIVLNYSEAEYLLALLSISYDTSMEIKEAKTISKINKFKEEDAVISFIVDEEDENEDDEDSFDGQIM